MLFNIWGAGRDFRITTYRKWNDNECKLKNVTLFDLGISNEYGQLILHMLSRNPLTSQ